MLPRSARLSHPRDFRRVTRGGVRAGRPSVVVHAGFSDRAGVRVGFVVSRSVGNAVVRNRVKRRLRHLAGAELDRTPRGTDVVVRALPRAAAEPARLSSDLASGWGQAVAALARRIPTRVTS